MIKSMTGFAAATREDEAWTASATVRAVNHRFLDVQLRVPPALAAEEAALRSDVQKVLARGRVEVAVTAQSRQPPVPIVELNEPFVGALERALEQARARGLVAGHLGPGDLLRLPQALVIREPATAQTSAGLAELVTAVLGQALGEVEAMRVREGREIAADLARRRQALAALLDGVVAAAAEATSALKARLTARVEELTAGLPVEPAAVAQEVVRVAARSDISEEVTRFRAHLVHWDALTASEEPCGRRLDFLLQEMNREVNTMGAKADGSQVPPLIVEMKAELERLREQVQNVE